MHHTLSLLALSLCIFLHGSALAQGQSEIQKDVESQIGKLVQDLSSPQFRVRERARVALEKIGVPALPALRKAVKSDDMEVSETAQKLVAKLERMQFTSKLLAPKTVHLKLKDATVNEALEELHRQSKYDIQINGDRTLLARTKITLDTGKTTFWKAFDQVCKAANLTQANVATDVRRSNYNIDSFVPVPPIQFQPVPAPVRIPKAINPKVLQKQLELIRKLQQKIQIRPNQLPNGANQNQLKRLMEMIERLQKEQQQQLKKIQDGIRKPAVAPAVPKGALQVQIRGAAQVQVQRAQVVPAQIQIFQPGRTSSRRIPNNSATSGQIVVQPGKAANIPTYYAGAVRIRVVSISNSKNGPALTLRIDAEPRLQSVSISGSPIIDRALDENGQELNVEMNSSAATNQPNQDLLRRTRVYYPNGRAPQTNQAKIQLKTGKKESALLKEFAGKLTLQLLSPAQPLAVVNNVLKNTKMVKGSDGSTLQVSNVAKLGNNRYQLEVHMEMNNNPLGGGNVFIGGNVIIRGNVVINGRRISSNNGNMPALLDKNGKAYQFAGVTRSSIRGVNGKLTREMIMQFQGTAGQGAPDRLVLTGRSLETVQVPFRFENVKLR